MFFQNQYQHESREIICFLQVALPQCCSNIVMGILVFQKPEDILI